MSHETRRWTPLLTCLAVLLSLADAVFAQRARPPSVGVAFGRSSPYVEDLARGEVGLPASGTVAVGAGVLVVARADLPVVGPVRARVEAGGANWPVHLATLDADRSAGTSGTRVGSIAVRHLDVLAGIRTGRQPACAHVSIGSGFYSFSLRGASFVRPATALAAGVEIQTGEHGVIQADAVLHAIPTGGHGFIEMSSVLALNLVVGWAYRF
jgi:hypothetical protein